MAEETMLRVNMPPVIHQTLDGEVIAVNLDSGVYYSLVGVAADVWQALDRGASSAAVLREAVARYDAPGSVVEPAVARFLEELRSEGLIVEAPAREPAATEADGNGAVRVPFSEPVLDKFTDMQELLVLDPIHDVDDAGWPHTPARTAQPG